MKQWQHSSSLSQDRSQKSGLRGWIVQRRQVFASYMQCAAATCALHISLARFQVKLCNRFGIKRYPTMKFGQATEFKTTNIEDLAEISGGQNSEELVKWLGKTLKTYATCMALSLQTVTSGTAKGCRWLFQSLSALHCSELLI